MRAQDDKNCMHARAIGRSLALCHGVAGVVDEDGTQRSPGLFLNSNVAVPALRIPASDVSLLLPGAAGALQSDIKLQVCSNDGQWPCLASGGALAAWSRVGA